MYISEERKKKLETEFVFSASRSSGPGGQNVNKVNTRVELRFSVISSEFITSNEKQIIQTKLKNRINSDGELILVAQSERSQWRNREKVTAKFFELIEIALTPVKRRIKTSPTYASRVKRIENKKKMSLKKQLRKPMKE
jgi:ribosome-associated protein